MFLGCFLIRKRTLYTTLSWQIEKLKYCCSSCLATCSRKHKHKREYRESGTTVSTHFFNISYFTKMYTTHTLRTRWLGSNIYISSRNLSLTLVRISPSRFFPCHVDLLHALGSFLLNPMPQTLSYGLASTSVFGYVENNVILRSSFCENWKI